MAPPLFRPLTIRNKSFNNHIWVVCSQLLTSGVTAPDDHHVVSNVPDSFDSGKGTDWYLVHLGRFSTRGAGAITVEAAAILPDGRISPTGCVRVLPRDPFDLRLR